MPLFGLVRRMLAQSQTKRLLKRMMREGDKYADIRLSSAVSASPRERPSPTGSSASTCRASDASPAVLPNRRCASRHSTAADASSGSDECHRDSRGNGATPIGATCSGNADGANQSSRLSVSACVVVPAQTATEALWIDKLRAQEETYKRSLCRSLSSLSMSSCSRSRSRSSSARRRCESEDDAFDMWDYVCPQLVRPRLANEWV